MKKTETTNANTELQFGDSIAKIASNLVGKTVRYLNLGNSSVNDSGIRHFKIKEIEDIAVSASTGRRYIRAEVADIDDNGETKFRTLHLGGISHVV